LLVAEKPYESAQSLLYYALASPVQDALRALTSIVDSNAGESGPAVEL
jgi:hypothetical protein